MGKLTINGHVQYSKLLNYQRVNPPFLMSRSSQVHSITSLDKKSPIRFTFGGKD
jgi:hypothetical protein